MESVLSLLRTHAKIEGYRSFPASTGLGDGFKSVPAVDRTGEW